MVHRIVFFLLLVYKWVPFCCWHKSGCPIKLALLMVVEIYMETSWLYFLPPFPIGYFLAEIMECMGDVGNINYQSSLIHE